MYNDIEDDKLANSYSEIKVMKYKEVPMSIKWHNRP